MAWYNEEQPEILNFMVVGNCHSGHDILQASLSAHPAMVCHGDLLHKEQKVRRSRHEDYFGESGKVPDWYQPREISVEHYLSNKIFDNSLHGEKAIGVRLDYDNFVVNDLWDYADQRCRQGDFCILHVSRNPVACFVDMQQAKGCQGTDGLPFMSARSICPEPTELTRFVRDHMANEIKINRLCGDRVVISYHELLLDFKGSLRQIFKFLELPYSSACIPNHKRINVGDIRRRIGNWTQLQAELPLDVRVVLESPTLF
jgi:hypothetical protein